MLDCLSSRDDGACLYLIDLEKPSNPVENVFPDKIIKSYDTYDDYGKLFCMSNHDTLFFYDSRDKILKQMLKVTNAIESKFNLIYNTFRDGRMINLVTMSNVLVFDIRNPGDCVLKFKHFCDVPPNRAIMAKSMDEECHRDIIDELMGRMDMQQFENRIDTMLRDNVEMHDKSLKNSMCLYSCRRNSFPIFLTSFEPYDKQDVENKFNYDIIKEINQSLDPNRLFSQLTRSDVHPQRLFSSNVIDPVLVTNGVSLLYHKEKVYFMHLDNEDNLSLQIIHRKDREKGEKGYAFKKLSKPANDHYVDSHDSKQLVKFVEVPLALKRKGSVTVDKTSLNVKSADIGDFDSESLELEPITDEKDKDFREYIDLRQEMKKLISNKMKFNFEDDTQKSNFAQYLDISKSMSDKEGGAFSNQTTPAIQHLAPPVLLHKEDVDQCEAHCNDRFFLTKNAIKLLQEKY